jgi:hypothetical protein
MRAFIVFLLSCASVFGADGGIQVFITTKTNAESITTKEFYTRDGQTNLVRCTETKAGVVQFRTHMFYHGGSLVGNYMEMPDSSGLRTEAGTAYSVSLSCDASRSLKSLVIEAKDGVIIDVFSYTNGVFSPLESSIISEANTAGSEVREMMEKVSERSRLSERSNK